MRKLIATALMFIVNFALTAHASSPDTYGVLINPNQVECRSDKPFRLAKNLEPSHVAECAVPGTLNYLVLNQYKGPIVFCWEKSLMAPEAQSEASARITVLVSGQSIKVQQLDVSGYASAPQAASLKQCLAKALETIKMPTDPSLANQSWQLKGDMSFGMGN